MYILEYVTEWENGESIVVYFEYETLESVNYLISSAITETSSTWELSIFGNEKNRTCRNHSFRIEEVN